MALYKALLLSRSQRSDREFFIHIKALLSKQLEACLNHIKLSPEILRCKLFTIAKDYS